MRLFLESFVDIDPVVLPKRLWTHTHTHTPPVFPPDTITIHLVNEMTKCKNRGIIQDSRQNGKIFLLISKKIGNCSKLSEMFN